MKEMLRLKRMLCVNRIERKILSRFSDRISSMVCETARVSASGQVSANHSSFSSSEKRGKAWGSVSPTRRFYR